LRRDIVIDMSEVETRAALLEDGKVVEFFFERAVELRLAGNIYKGVVENVLPGIQSAFVNIGLDKNAFLFIGDMLLDEKRKDVKIEHLIRVGGGNHRSGGQGAYGNEGRSGLHEDHPSWEIRGLHAWYGRCGGVAPHSIRRGTGEVEEDCGADTPQRFRYHRSDCCGGEKHRRNSGRH